MYVICGVGLGSFLLYRDVTRFNHNSEIIRDRKRKKEKLEDPSLVPLDYNKNIAIIGKNGSGKTVAISNFVQGHIESGQFCVIMDGKGDVGQFSLYDIVTKLCMKHKRKLYILNQSMPDETHSYNPFEGCNSTQIKDMLISMSDWSEEHYKALASEYFQALAQFMIDTRIPVSFNNLIYYGMIENFLNELEYKVIPGESAGDTKIIGLSINKNDDNYFASQKNIGFFFERINSLKFSFDQTRYVKK